MAEDPNNPAETQRNPGETRPAAGYAPLQRRLHWIVAALVLFQLLIGLVIGIEGSQPQPPASLRLLLVVHLVIGTAIFAIMWKRLALRRRLGAPPPPAGTPVDAALLARANHLGFYGLLLALPVLGWLAYLSGPSAAAGWGALHGGLALVLALAVCAHLSGVAYHSYVRHDGLLRRMME